MKKKLLLSLTSITAVTAVAALVSCSQTPPYDGGYSCDCERPRRPYDRYAGWIKKGAAIYEKTTLYNQPYIKLTTVGYNDYTFSDGYWTYKDNKKSVYKELDKLKKLWSEQGNRFYSEWAENYFLEYKSRSLFTANFTKKNQWKYDAKIHKWGSKFEKGYVDSLFKNFNAQKSLPTNLKTISLVKNQDELKKALRLTDEDQVKYKEYFERVHNENKLSNFDYKKYMPWSATFNYEEINKKLDFEKYDYLFLKDFLDLRWERIEQNREGKGVPEMETGVEIADIKINPDKKRIEIGLHIDNFEEQYDGDSHGSYLDSEQMSKGDRLTSFLVPVEKGKIQNFDLNDYKIKML
ncbi:hypothetical protein [Mycoplasmopsis agassizii]|uniref:Lipoprotein n=1 Tax=Mycoplasmopsis agassizii TaxID=33922 RepID=A0ABX4H5I6_9BACT|nr:hypothetical protein [Mycoplasmopsis agassizii]PAF55162.1 hypothetical protein CJF60_00550 [Mycoplasmopsis agassizii]SMC16830.1 hypothetical protein SAMN02745179_00333 [Mycoplasmopsis agassizii]